MAKAILLRDGNGSAVRIPAVESDHSIASFYAQ